MEVEETKWRRCQIGMYKDEYDTLTKTVENSHLWNLLYRAMADTPEPVIYQLELETESYIRTEFIKTESIKR